MFVSRWFFFQFSIGMSNETKSSPLSLTVLHLLSDSMVLVHFWLFFLANKLPRIGVLLVAGIMNQIWVQWNATWCTNQKRHYLTIYKKKHRSPNVRIHNELMMMHSQQQSLIEIPNANSLFVAGKINMRVCIYDYLFEVKSFAWQIKILHMD